MTYLAFHAIFILPPLLALPSVLSRAAERFGPRALWTLPAVAAIALVYTTPWDNYLVYRGVWWYGADRVIGTIGYVPVEEYLFFVLQPLVAGAWLYHILTRGLFGARGLFNSPALSGPTPRLDAVGSSGPAPGRLLAGQGSVRRLGLAAYALATAAGVFALTWPSGLYLGLILVWASPVLAAQWAFVAGRVARAPRTFVAAVSVPTVYLWVADRVAIGAGVWSISPSATTGLHLLGLPVEEAVFFLVTNLLVVQGVLLFLGPALNASPRRATALAHD
ncbi:MAG TPA: lycopene cyclase domain-containing protein [Longimicrobiales bacterium]|nr:lycopene cyclase domain-containing protein [Longimicrobiales bacterium]